MTGSNTRSRTVQYHVAEDNTTVTTEILCDEVCFRRKGENAAVEVIYLPPSAHDPRVAVIKDVFVRGRGSVQPTVAVCEG